MSTQLIVKGRRKARGKLARRIPLRAVFTPAPGVAGVRLAYPWSGTDDGEDSRRTLITGSISALLHLAAFGFLVLLASLAPSLDDTLIPVQLLRNDPALDEPAPAPKALAERRSLRYAPAAQTVAPQIVNPRVIAAASPAVRAEAVQMDAVSSVAAPTAIERSTTVVERLSAVNSVAHARAADVDVSRVAAPVVRGPTQVDAPAGPSVGPRKIEAADAVPTMGIAPLAIGSGDGSSVREGLLSSRDVIGSPDGPMIVSVDTAIGNSHLRGSGGTGTGLAPAGGGSPSEQACMHRPEVVAYMSEVKSRTIARWVLPPGVDANHEVRLRFRLDTAGSARKVSVVEADDNALGASAVDALRAASPFPPMPESARCLSDVSLIATFKNPSAG
ncbi:MAG: TonB family protein [Myxococcales bacterium]|nr:TonB family protein [Myxococcales bacterium]MDH5306676.1 TonB family protein [Myxococcales bacterium]MDH5567099.1 TonB family protein [Myxococcales bacterium]